MTLALAEVARNIRCAVAKKCEGMCCFCHVNIDFIIERGELMVEFDSMKITLSDYEKPLIEMGNSL